MTTFTSENQVQAEKQKRQCEQELAATMTIQNYQRLLAMTFEQVSYFQNEVQQLREHNQALEAALNKQANQAFHDKDDLRYFLTHAQKQNELLQANIQILKGTVHAREVAILTLQQEKNVLEQQLLLLRTKLETESKYHYADKNEFIQTLETKAEQIDDLRQKLQYRDDELAKTAENQYKLQIANEELLDEITKLHAEIQKQVITHWHEQLAEEDK